jgi:two-component system response regulator FlrC
MDQILVVDDDSSFRKLLATILRGEGYAIDEAGSVGESVSLSQRKQYDLVLSDLRLPDGDGLQVLDNIREGSPETPVIMITAYAAVNSAVEAMKRGATDYLGKPLSSPDELRLLVKRSLDQRRLASHHAVLREEVECRFHCENFITHDAKMRQVLELIKRVAPTDTTVLLLGESGTGKEVLARCVHQNSARSTSPFVPVNCAALSPTLIESELFGHEKGAFTGAITQHVGRFERARGGTIFLDEIGELSAELQAKLLRVLQEKTIERVGGTRVIPVDVRVIAATNQDLDAKVKAGDFREDLFYRLNAFPVKIPPLRDRPRDIGPLAQDFLERLGAEGRPSARLGEEAMQCLKGYPWPGNVRELQNVIERAAIIADGVIQPEHLPFHRQTAPRPRTLAEIERQAIEDALREFGGNRTKAAERLGISLRTLQYRLREYAEDEAKGP